MRIVTRYICIGVIQRPNLAWTHEHHRAHFRTSDLHDRPRDRHRRIGPARRHRTGRGGRRRAGPGQAPQVRRPHLARGRRHQRRPRHDGCRRQLAAARRRHAEGELPARQPAHGRDRHLGRGSRHRRPRALRHAVRPRGGRPHLAALLRRPHVPPHGVRGRLHGARDPAHAHQSGRAAERADPRHGLRHAHPRQRRRRGLRRLRLRPRRRDPLPHPRRRGHPRRRRPQPHLAAHLVAARREHGRLVPARRRGGRSAARPRTRAVPPLGHHRARERGRHPDQRGGPR